ncbi:MAG: TspO/MBR family protein [Hyphomicrobium sp.]
MNILSFLVFLALVSAAAVTGAQYMPGPWYEALNKPSWTPPNWLFPIAWTVLYVMIAIAGWLVWKKEGAGSALMIWGVCLVLNALWSYVMFGRHDIGLALINVAALWLAIIAFIWAAWPVDRTASYLFMPYLVWVSFASALNAAVFAMNR